MKIRYSIIFLLIYAFISCQKSSENKQEKSFESTTQASDGVTISYDVRGSGSTALVFIHGWCSNKTFWREQLNTINDKYRAVSIDLPGHGKSGHDREVCTFSSFANDVKRVVESLDLKKVVLIGHSMGGLIALKAAQLMPNRIIGIVGIDAINNVEDVDPPEMMEPFISVLQTNFKGTIRVAIPRMLSPNATPELIEWVTENSLEADSSIAISIVREISNVNQKNLLSSVFIPVRCIYAASDDSTVFTARLETNQKYADFDAVAIKDVGHFLHLEKPDEVNQHLMYFVSEIEKANYDK